MHLCSHLCPPLARASELVGYVHSACFEVEGHKQSVIGGRDVRGRDFHGRGGAGQKSMGRDGAGQGSESAGQSRADVAELANHIQLHNHDHNYCCHSVPLWAS